MLKYKKISSFFDKLLSEEFISQVKLLRSSINLDQDHLYSKFCWHFSWSNKMSKRSVMQLSEKADT